MAPWVWGVLRFCAAMALAIVPVGVASSQTPDEALFLRRDDLRIVPFANIEGGRSVFVTLGLKQSLTGPLDRQGIVAMETIGYGLTREGTSVSGSIYRHTLQTSSLIGYQFSFGRAFLSGFLGPEVTWEQVTIGGAIERWSEPQLGARVQLELWFQTDDVLLTATAVAGTTQGSLWTRGSAGYRLFGNVFAGPEATFFMTDTYHEWRLGGHITGVSLGRVDLRLSAGVQNQDDDRASSPYVGMAGYFKM